jgi:hypothetical protein
VFRFICRFCEAVAESLSVVSTAMLANVAVIDPGEVERSACIAGIMLALEQLPWGTLTLTGKSSVCLFSTFTSKCLLCK